MIKYIRNFYYFLKVVLQQRYIIKKLVISDFQKKYLATYLGLPWAFIQPVAIILVIWFVVSIGLRGSDLADGTPFLPWFICGMVPWFFMRDAISGSANSLIEFSFLIKKMHFRLGIIPVIKITTNFIIHLFLTLVLIIIIAIHGYPIDLYCLQLFYYMLCAVILVTGIGWLTSSIMVFVRDIKQAIDILLTLLFWLTPILWSYTRLKGNAKLLATLNPLHYVINGYRESLIFKIWFFENPQEMICFWSIAILLFVSGAIIFTRLKPHFADVL
ncbi:MAG TPA: ABC transporter permease [Salinivirgaceae bacterium]|nr:ABC transporter permease [Salinivirgaceae bacterium]HQA75515.1 ABC transporter permease [Salinivirgaceae bacterium]